MTDPSIFTLKNAKSVKIGTELNPIQINVEESGEDVERIKILNDIVWERGRTTHLVISVQPIAPVVGQDLILRAYIVDNHNENVDGDIEFTGNGINGAKTITARNGVAELSIPGNNIVFDSENTNNRYTYTARYAGKGKYSSSETSTTIEFIKDTPTIQVIGLTENKNLYYGWRIGCKLINTNGAPIKNHNVNITINGVKYTTPHTNEKGIASLNIALDTKGTYTATFQSQDTSQYNTATTQYTYNYKRFNEIEIPILSYSSEGSGQVWDKISDNKYQCGVVTSPCNGIQKGQFTQNLKIIFNKNNNNSKFYEIRLSFDSYSMKNECHGLNMGGLFEDKPQIKLKQTENGIFEVPKNQDEILSFPTQSNIYNYSSHNKLSQIIIWNDRISTYTYQQLDIDNNPVVSIQYKNKTEAPEEGAIQLDKIRLILLGTPNQNFSWS